MYAGKYTSALFRSSTDDGVSKGEEGKRIYPGMSGICDFRHSAERDVESFLGARRLLADYYVLMLVDNYLRLSVCFHYILFYGRTCNCQSLSDTNPICLSGGQQIHPSECSKSYINVIGVSLLPMALI